MNGMIETVDLDVFRERLAGTVLVPGQPEYDDARTIFNRMIDRRPAVIARCAGRADVVEAIAFARSHDLEIAVRGGGHSVAGAGLTDGGLVIDLRAMREVEVDADARTMRVAGGATWADVDRACQPHGPATTGGRVSTTGVAGLTLGGGSGWLERLFGLACDSLIAVELATADGRIVTASEDEHPELFWALHGGGGNFGVATALTFRLHPLVATTLALLVFPPERGPSVVGRYRDLIESGAPEELGGGVLYVTGPPEEFVPEHLVDELLVLVAGVFAGPEAEARRTLQPLFDLGPAGEMVAELPYDELQSALDDPPGYRNYWSAEHLSSFPDEAVTAFCDRAHDMVVPSPSQHALLPWGGAVARPPQDWPVANRHAIWCVHPLGLWDDPRDDARGIAWAKALGADMKPFAVGGAYLNFTPDEGTDRVVAGYGGTEKYRRLAAVKAEFDPANLFHLNHNIEPAADRVAG
jgi:FAD/FMN-containing dehydrogenase